MKLINKILLTETLLTGLVGCIHKQIAVDSETNKPIRQIRVYKKGDCLASIYFFTKICLLKANNDGCTFYIDQNNDGKYTVEDTWLNEFGQCK